MSEEMSPDIAALYRASATEEPDVRLDAAILRAARRSRGRTSYSRWRLFCCSPRR